MYLEYEARPAASPGPKTVKYEYRITPKYPAVVINNETPIAIFRFTFLWPLSIDQITKNTPHTMHQVKGVIGTEKDGLKFVFENASIKLEVICGTLLLTANVDGTVSNGPASEAPAPSQ